MLSFSLELSSNGIRQQPEKRALMLKYWPSSKVTSEPLTLGKGSTSSFFLSKTIHDDQRLMDLRITSLLSISATWACMCSFSWKPNHYRGRCTDFESPVSIWWTSFDAMLFVSFWIKILLKLFKMSLTVLCCSILKSSRDVWISNICA